MDNLTTTILSNNYQYDIEEWVKQGQGVSFDSGKEQRVVGASIPAMSVEISYSGLTVAEYDALRSAYESNHSKTFIVDFGTPTDLRSTLMTINASVWTFGKFQFYTEANDRLYNGRITLVTSVFFNFTKYQNLFTQTSSYTPSYTTNTDFTSVLSNVPAYRAEYSYISNSLFSGTWQSSRYIKEKGGLLSNITLTWLVQEADFVSLLTFYRKKGGIMGQFGMPSVNGATPETYAVADYIVNQDDYVLLDTASDYLLNTRFKDDSFHYVKRVDGMYEVQAEFIEVRNG